MFNILQAIKVYIIMNNDEIYKIHPVFLLDRRYKRIMIMKINFHPDKCLNFNFMVVFLISSGKKR